MNKATVCVDLGYGYTKAIIRFADGSEKTITLPSVYGPVGRELFNGHERKRLRVWDTDYYYGADALKYCREPITSRDRHRPKEMIEALFLGACTDAGLFTGRCEVYTALPVEWMSDAAGLRTHLAGKHHARRLDLEHDVNLHVIGDDASSDPISQSGVQVYPQPLLAFLNRAAQREDLWEDWSSVLVVDVGTGTFNQCLIVGGDWIDERATSRPFGMGTMLELALQEQERRTGRRDLLLVARAKLWQREESFCELCRPYIEVLADNIIQTAADIAGNLSLTEVILTGGGASYVTAPVRDRFNGVPVYVSADPEMDNVRGMMVATTG